MKGINFIFIFLLVLTLMSFVVAQPPFQISGGGGLEIAGIDFSAIQTNTTRTAVAHVFNASDGLPLYSGVSCSFYVYRVGVTEALLYTNHTPSIVNNTFSFLINNSVYSVSAEYTRIIQCNNSLYGGFYKSSFIANPTATEQTTASSISIFIPFILMLLMMFAFLFLSGIVKTKEYKWSFIIIGMGFFVLTIAYGITASKETLAQFSTLDSWILAIVKILSLTVTIGIVVIAIIALILVIKRVFDVRLGKQIR